MTQTKPETVAALDIDARLTELLAALCAGLPDLCSVSPKQVLTVLASARGQARASVRSLHGPRAMARVRLSQGIVLYELSLRPMWFRDSSPRRRLETLIHELWHMGHGKDGQLDPERGHGVEANAELRRIMPGLLNSCLLQIDPRQIAWLAHDGLAQLRSWLRRPLLTGETGSGGNFTDADLYMQTVDMQTSAERKSHWRTLLSSQEP